jgi:hypothetical protein
MPERQIPWRVVAKRLSGALEVRTGVTGTQLELKAEVDGIKVQVDANSWPYASSGGRTEIRALAKHPFGAKIYIVRNIGTVPLHRRFLLRDVIVGAPIFDDAWIINASRESQAQALLDARVCSLIDKVPVSRTPANYISELREVFYEFSIRGREVMAHTNNFETDPERLGAAIAAAVALANQHKALLAQWRTLARELDGSFEDGPRFRLDGTTHIRFPLLGRPLRVAPISARLKWRRDRLRTRISCEASGNRSRKHFQWNKGDSFEAIGEHRKAFKSAVEESAAVYVRSNSKMVEVQLDGNIRDTARIIAASSLAALLSRGDEHSDGPYR